MIRLIHQGRSRRHHIPKSFLNHVAHLSHAHLMDCDQEAPIAKIAAIQSFAVNWKLMVSQKRNPARLCILPGAMTLNKHKPIMENPVRDTKVTMVEVSQMRRLGRCSHVKRRLPTRRIFVTGVLVDDDHNNTTTTTTELSVGTTTTSPVVVVVPLLSSSSRRRKVLSLIHI